MLPNPWDLGTARMPAGLGFKALATTSSGFAWSQGYADGRGAARGRARTFADHSNHYGARWSLMVGAVAALVGAGVGIRYLVRHRGLSVRREGWRLRFTLAEPAVRGVVYRTPDNDAPSS